MSYQPKLCDQDGLRAEAEDLHSKYNKMLQCPRCGNMDSKKGTFTKDSAGSANKEGLRYRRFVCRPNGGCGTTFGVIEFITLRPKGSLVPNGK